MNALIAGGRPRGSLVEPGTVTGRCWRIRFSTIAEHRWCEGAVGAPFLAQLRRGPVRWQMFFSCMGFAIPAVIHVAKRQHLADIAAAIGLLCVSISSPLCDAFCVDSCVYDAGCEEVGVKLYSRASACLQASPEGITRTIKESQALPEIIANDQWNNLTRFIDRATCAFLVLPSMVFFGWRQRPNLLANVPFIGGFFVAWFICLADQRHRYLDPCGTRFIDGHWKTEPKYLLHQRLHELWHYTLIITLTCSALYRPAS